MTNQPPRRLKMLRVTLDTIGGLFKDDVHIWKAVNSAPNGSTVVDSYIDHERRTLFITYEHPSFPEVRDGEYIPTLDCHILDKNEAVREFIKTSWFKIKMEEVLNEEEIRLGK